MLAQAFDNLQEALGYRWQEPKLLKLAVLHGSASEAANNCLAWLGDAVLYAIVTGTPLLQPSRACCSKLVHVLHCCTASCAACQECPLTLSVLQST